MDWLEFRATGKKIINQTVQAHRTKAYTKAVEDLQEALMHFSALIQEISGEALDVRQTTYTRADHSEVRLILMEQDTQRLFLVVFLVAKNGRYPIAARYSEKDPQSPTFTCVDREGIMQALLNLFSHDFTPAVKLLANHPKVLPGAVHD